MDRRAFNRLLATGLAGAGASRLIGRAGAAEPLKVGFVYLGPVGDFGWSYQHEAGRKQAVAALGDKIATTFVENVPEGPDSQTVMASLAAKGNKLIFATSFGYMNYVLKAAQQFPGVMFEHATGYKRAKNVATYDIRFYQGRYVQGVIAGKLSQKGVAGYVGSIPVPEVVQGMNAFLLGMRSVNPAAQLKFVMCNSWYDPGKEGDAARALIDQGCDIITQHTDSPTPLQVAASRGIKGFGEATDMVKFAPTTQLTAIVNNWGGYYQQRIQAMLAGTWKSTDTWGGFHSGMLEMAPLRNMPDDVRKLAEATVADISAGKNKIFTGPLKDQSGAVKLAAGKTLTDAELSSLQWLVQGVEGKLS
ncbi:MAG: BMP family ABC transporter substrate-binding protein [Rhodospirillales bacterium]|nr:BMP family ABC transporter substrate-binding protein [Rhodospirillales bacterium]